MNVKKMMTVNKRQQKLLELAMDAATGMSYGRSFWRPILSRWLTWWGCSAAVGSVLVFAPLIKAVVKEMFQ